ncbi:MAG TPA: hypothetical protein VD791_05960 [Burkholderiales bacterium]|nr:hypothetical protein [Burkholderiales bacterium]
MQALEPLARLWRGLYRPWSRRTRDRPLVGLGLARMPAAPPADWVGEAAAARSRASEARARKLLCRMLSTSQLKELETHGCFTVEVTGRGRFCILPRTTFNVFHVQSGNLYCCNTEAFVPLSDLMLAQKLLLERDPDRFFAVANCRPEVFAGPWEQQLRRALNREQERAPRRGQAPNFHHSLR